jgi:hypothetical protein
LRLLQAARAYPTHSVFFGTKVANRTFFFFAYLVEGRGYAPLRSACKADKLLLHQPSISVGLGPDPRRL